MCIKDSKTTSQSVSGDRRLQELFHIWPHHLPVLISSLSLIAHWWYKDHCDRGTQFFHDFLFVTADTNHECYKLQHFDIKCAQSPKQVTGLLYKQRSEQSRIAFIASFVFVRSKHCNTHRQALHLQCDAIPSKPQGSIFFFFPISETTHIFIFLLPVCLGNNWKIPVNSNQHKIYGCFSLRNSKSMFVTSMVKCL